MPFLMREQEVTLLTKYLKPEHRVLEVGSGESTLEFASIAKEVVSLEHNARWYKNVLRRLKPFDNVTYVLKRPNQKWKRYKTDGDYKSFKDYVDFLSSLKDEHFDLVLIDGRARKDCMLAIGEHHPDAFFFLHDFYQDEEQLKKNPSRRGYLEILEKFELIEIQNTLAVFKYKKVNDGDMLH